MARPARGRPLPVALSAVLAAITLPGVSIAGAADLDLGSARKAPSSAAPCASVVVRRCAPTEGADTVLRSPPAAVLRPGAGADPSQVLETIVIEGERMRRPTPSVRSAIEAATARPTARSFESGDGGICTCVTPCPPWPLPCCSCTKGGREAMIDNAVRH